MYQFKAGSSLFDSVLGLDWLEPDIKSVWIHSLTNWYQKSLTELLASRLTVPRRGKGRVVGGGAGLVKQNFPGGQIYFGWEWKEFLRNFSGSQNKLAIELWWKRIRSFFEGPHKRSGWCENRKSYLICREKARLRTKKSPVSPIVDTFLQDRTDSGDLKLKGTELLNPLTYCELSIKPIVKQSVVD